MSSDITLSRAALAVILDPLTHEPIDPSKVGPFFWDLYRIVYESVPGTPVAGVAGVASVRPAWTAGLARQAVSHTVARWQAGADAGALQADLDELATGFLQIPVVIYPWWIWPPVPVPFGESKDPYLTSPEGMPGVDVLAAATEFHRAAEAATEENAAKLPAIAAAAPTGVGALHQAFASVADRLYAAGVERLFAKCELL
jgi:hypothetical protein